MSGRRALAILAAVAAAGCALGLWRVIAALCLSVPLDPNEGWNAYHAAAAIAGAPLYPGTDRFMVNNYPPLSFYAVGWLGWIVGDAIVAGRLVDHLERAGFVVMKRPAGVGAAALGRGFEG